MKVILTPDALADLDHIAEHIEKDNPASHQLCRGIA